MPRVRVEYFSGLLKVNFMKKQALAALTQWLG